MHRRVARARARGPRGARRPAALGPRPQPDRRRRPFHDRGSPAGLRDAGARHHGAARADGRHRYPRVARPLRAGGHADRPFAFSGVRREQGRRDRDTARQGPAASLRRRGGVQRARDAAPGGVHPGVEAAQRAAQGVPQEPQPHGDRGGRVRRCRRPGDDGGRDRADRRRHRGRVRLRRRRGQHRPREGRPVPRQGADRDRRFQRVVRHPLQRPGIRHHRRAGDVALRARAQARRSDQLRQPGLQGAARRQPQAAPAAGRQEEIGMRADPSSLILAFVLGAVTVAGYAPFDLYLLPVITVAGLCYLWHGARTPRAAATIGYAFGLGWFLFGVSWVYVSMHDFGGMHPAAAAVATLAFCAFLALFPAAVGYACGRWVAAPAARYGLLVPAVWALTEWTRGWIFTGFPWLALGYSQIPGSPLAGYAPVLGIHGVTLATAATAGLLVSWWVGASAKAEAERRKAAGRLQAKALLRVILHPSSFILVALWAGGWGFKQVEWTQPVGEPVTVTLLQGNIPQDLKWREDRVETTLKTYSALAWMSSSRLIILPETALPLFLDQVPRDYLD